MGRGGVTRAILRLPPEGRDKVLPLLDQWAKLDQVTRSAPAWALALLRDARVGRLATADAAGRPLVVPVCCARAR